MSNVIYLNGVEQFSTEVLNSTGIVLVDFYADRCAPCQMLWPILEQVSLEAEGKAVKVVKINVDQNSDLATQFNVMSIPVVFFIKHGKMVESVVGLRDKNFYQNKIASLL